VLFVVASVLHQSQCSLMMRPVVMIQDRNWCTGNYSCEPVLKQLPYAACPCGYFCASYALKM